MDEGSLPEHTEQVLRGVVDRVTFRNPENGYSVLQITLSEKSSRVTVVGSTLEVQSGSHVMVRGVYQTHPKFGRQFKASAITQTTPSSPEGIERYLSSGLIKGVGEKTAQRLVETFGADAIRLIQEEPETIAKVSGVGKKKAALLHEAFAKQDELNSVMRFLVENEISPLLAAKIYKLYGNKTIEVLSKNPYRLARDVFGVGFATADAIAIKLGLRMDSPERLQAGISYTLEKAADDGHSHLPGTVLSERARALLGVDEGVDLTPSVNTLLQEGFLVQHGEGLFLPHLHRAEEFIAQFVAARVVPRPEPLIDEAAVKAALANAEEQLKVQFSYEQQQTVHLAARERLLIITGGPGCGKTTIIRAISFLFRAAGKRLLLAAPTGRASQRMAQVCEMPASTIHRLLKYDPVARGFQYGPKQPLVADAVVIDEASMIDLPLAMHLLSALPAEATLILVGDKDQLPSVGPGRLFADLISLSEVRTVALQRLFRRAEGSSINTIAHAINCGQVPDIPTPDGETKTDAYFIPRSEPDEAAATIEKLVSDQLPRKFGFRQDEILVLTPTNRGPLGTLVLNQRIQEAVNPLSGIDPEQQLTVGAGTIRLRDRVVQQVNNYQLGDQGVFNGDLGMVYGIDRRQMKLTVELWDGRLITYESGDIHQLSLAYALTVHRSQGSEIPCVVLALHDSHYALLERQLIYTGITRAKKMLVIVGSKRALAIACKRATAHRRLSMLVERVRAFRPRSTPAIDVP